MLTIVLPGPASGHKCFFPYPAAVTVLRRHEQDLCSGVPWTTNVIHVTRETRWHRQRGTGTGASGTPLWLRWAESAKHLAWADTSIWPRQLSIPIWCACSDWTVAGYSCARARACVPLAYSAPKPAPWPPSAIYAIAICVASGPGRELGRGRVFGNALCRTVEAALASQAVRSASLTRATHGIATAGRGGGSMWYRTRMSADGFGLLFASYSALPPPQSPGLRRRPSGDVVF